MSPDFNFPNNSVLLPAPTPTHHNPMEVSKVSRGYSRWAEIWSPQTILDYSPTPIYKVHNNFQFQRGPYSRLRSNLGFLITFSPTRSSLCITDSLSLFHTLQVWRLMKQDDIRGGYSNLYPHTSHQHINPPLLGGAFLMSSYANVPDNCYFLGVGGILGKLVQMAWLAHLFQFD